ncbi:MAG: dTMP kinase [Rikenellaceae bacterium]
MFIVLEGLDGAGKSTQVNKLKDYFQSQGKECEYLHFPRFDTPIYGDLIARFLRGELGSLESVDPYLVALLYAGDRAEAAEMIRGWLKDDKVVIFDRYVYSNIGYQCAKVSTTQERDALRDWILNLEYNFNSIPRPDVSLFLDVPFAFTEAKLTAARAGDDRDYLKGQDDIHESSLTLQQCVREVYLSAAEVDTTLHVVDCSDANNSMDTPDNIFDKIISIIE